MMNKEDPSYNKYVFQMKQQSLNNIACIISELIGNCEEDEFDEFSIEGSENNFKMDIGVAILCQEEVIKELKEQLATLTIKVGKLTNKHEQL